MAPEGLEALRPVPRLETRRGFLASVATISAPLLCGFPLRGIGSPGNRITMACIGVGKMGSENLKGFLWQDGVQMVAVCDVDAKRAAAARDLVTKHYRSHRKRGSERDCTQYSDFREVIARDDIDAVCVSTADHWHVLVSLAAVRSGKDVYCEKPISAFVHEGRVLSDEVRRYGRIFQMGSQQRSDQRFRFACELVRNGRIGRLTHMEVGLPKGRATGVHPEMAIPRGFDYDLWLGPAPWAPYTEARCHYNFRFIRDYSGGQMLNFGAHHLDIAQWGNGSDRSGPVWVKGRGEFPKEGLYNNPVSYSVDYRYADGVTLNCSTGNRDGVRFLGTDGWVYVTRGKIEAEPEALLKSVIGPEEIHLYESNSHRATFLRCVRERSETVAPAEVGHRSATMGHIGNIAMLLGRELNWDPETEQFNDAEANRMLNRAMRGPWSLSGL